MTIATRNKQAAHKKPPKSARRPEHDELVPENAPADELQLERTRVRYLLERRLGRPVERLAKEALGLTLTFHIIEPQEKEALTFHPSGRDNPYCKLVYSTTEGLKRCSACYAKHLEEAKGLRDPLTYTCHAGLTNILVPIYSDHKLMGGLLVGRVFVNDASEKIRKGLAEKVKDFVPDTKAAQNALGEVPVLAEPDLQFAGLLAKNLSQTESPMLLEGQVFDPNPPNNIQTHTPITTDAPLPVRGSETYSTVLHHQRVCQTVIALLERHFASSLSVAKLADAVKLTPNYLSSIFRKTCGTTLSQYLTAIRIRKAQGFLRRTDVNIKEVAFRVGFNDANHFCVVFKKVTGLTPTQWRAQLDAKLLGNVMSPDESLDISLKDEPHRS